MPITSPDSVEGTHPSALPIVINPAHYRGHLRIERAELPPVFAGRPLVIPITLRNDSPAVWPAAGDCPVRVAYHWLHADGSMWIRNGRRTNLIHDLGPGESMAIDARIDPPEMPGQAVLQLTAVQEDRSWFELHGFSSVDLNVEILDFTGL